MEKQDLRTALPDRLETARLILRAPERRDVADMARLANNAKIHAMLSRMPHPYHTADAEDFINDVARGADEHAYGIISHDNGFIGIVSVTFANGKSPEIGYWLGEPYWGQGYATEAAGALVDAAQTCGLTSLTARAIAHNTGSRRVLEKLGFELTSQSVGDCGPHAGIEIAFYKLGPLEVRHDHPA